MTDLLPCIELNPDKLAVGSVIWLHGLGADGNDFKPIVPALNLPKDLPLRFIFPHAPIRPVSINGGAQARAWFDIEMPLRVNEEHIEESAQHLKNLIQREIDLGIPYYRIVVAGFSQGGVIALQTGLTLEHSLAGIIGLSTFLPNLETIEKKRHSSNFSSKIFLAHGSQDPMIPVSFARSAHQALEKLDYKVQWQEYVMGHEVCPTEIRDISQWLQKRFLL